MKHSCFYYLGYEKCVWITKANCNSDIKDTGPPQSLAIGEYFIAISQKPRDWKGKYERRYFLNVSLTCWLNVKKNYTDVPG